MKTIYLACGSGVASSGMAEHTLKKKLAIVGTIFAVDVLSILVFGVGLGWL